MSTEKIVNPARKIERSEGRLLDRFGKDTSGRLIGAGKSCDDPSQIAAAIVDGLNCGIEDLEVVAENRAFFNGPLTPTQTNNFFTPKINPFTIGTNQGAVDQAQINIDSGEMDCNVLITHMYFHLVGPKNLMLVEGGVTNTIPTVNGNGPVVPDTWLKTDAATDGTGTLGLGSGAAGTPLAATALTKAYLDTGEWVLDAFYDFCRAYEWIWKIGNNVIMEAPLTKIASIRNSAQESTSGRGRLPFAQYVSQYNSFARANGGTGLFFPRNATQSGTITVGGTVLSLLQEYGYGEEEVTYGGPGVQELCSNPTVYELCTAQLFPRGVKLGNFFNMIDENAQTLSQQEWQYTTPGQATTPGIINPDTNVGGQFVGTGALPVFQTLTSDIAGPARGFQQQPYGQVVCKIGNYYLIAGLMGHRVSQTLYQKAVSNESAVCDAVTAGTFGKRSLSMMAGK